MIQVKTTFSAIKDGDEFSLEWFCLAEIYKKIDHGSAVDTVTGQKIIMNPDDEVYELKELVNVSNL